jgi:hypothetical protein
MRRGSGAIGVGGIPGLKIETWGTQVGFFPGVHRKKSTLIDTSLQSV